MKVGILTFHRAYNYGAFMQCYALSNEIKKCFPEATVEVIDYASENMLSDYKTSWKNIFGTKRTNGKKPFIIICKRLVKTLLNNKKNKIAKFYRQFLYNKFNETLSALDLSEGSLVSDDVDMFKNFLQDKYDAIVVGSDAIWNDNQTSWPNMYFLHDITGCKKLSYAASTYGMDYSEKSDSELKYVSESLADFDFIGVRDSATEDYVQQCLLQKLAVHTCDPSIFLNINELPIDDESIKNKLKAHGVDFSRSTICLMCSEWLAKEVRRNLGDDFQYVSVYCKNGYEDIYLYDLTPFEWAKAFSFFNATFTHFFHGTLFSIKNGTLTYSIEKKSDYKKKYKTKIQDVLGRLNLTQDCYREIEKIDNHGWVAIKQNILNANPTLIKAKYFEAVEKEAQTKEPFFDALRKIAKDG